MLKSIILISRKMKIFFTTTFILLLMGSLSASEIIDKDINEAEDFATMMFNELDLNRDGKVDIKELRKFSLQEFKTIDKNNDGKISKTEFFEFICDKSCRFSNCECKNYKDKSKLDYMQEYWSKIDTNQDGYISFEEKYKVDLEDFQRMDVYNRGTLTKKDFESQLY